MFKALCCQMAEINEKLSESGGSSGETNEKLDTVNENLEQVIESLTLMLEEMTNDDNFGDTLWETPTGDVVIKRVVKNDDGTETIEYLNPNETPYTGSTSDLKPYSRQTIITTTDYCSNGIPFTAIQFRDHDTKAVIATIWRNDNTLADQVTAPANAVKGSCVAGIENKSYQILANKTITFAAGSIYRWEAGVYNGESSYTEGGSSVGPYKIGEGFGNGDFNNIILNINPVSITTNSLGDVRISVLQVPGYTPTII